MKNIPDKIKQNVSDGLVLDEKGNWVTVAEKVERERCFRMHLEAGEVLHNGNWMKISEAKKQEQDNNGGVAMEEPDSMLLVGAYTELEETRDLTDRQGNKSTPQILQNNRNTVKTPSNAYVNYPTIDAEEETKYLEIKRSTVDSYRNNHRNPDDNEYLEETMTIDMKAYMSSSREPVGKFTNSYQKANQKKAVIDDVAESWEIERKKSQVLIFAVSLTAAAFAIVGAAVLAFFL